MRMFELRLVESSTRPNSNKGRNFSRYAHPTKASALGCLSAVVFEQSAQPLLASDFRQGYHLVALVRGWLSWFVARQQLVILALMRPLLVVVRQILSAKVIEVGFPKDHEVGQALPL